MKRLISCMLMLLLLLSLAACGGSPAPSTEEPASEPEAEQEPTPEPEPEPEVNALDLTGQWKEVNPESEDEYYGAVIDGDKIEIHRVRDDGGTRYLYWAGTYIPPEREADSYSWTSQTGWHRTDREAIAANKETLNFTYQDNRLSYSISNDGIIKWIEMEHEDWAPDLGISNVPDELKSGFDPVTNQEFTYEGITFSIPAYFDTNGDAFDDGRSWEFYPIGADYHCLLIFQILGLEKISQIEYDNDVIAYMEQAAEQAAEDSASIETKEDSIAGLPAKTYSYRYYDEETERHASVHETCAYIPSITNAITITHIWYDGDLSGYDYAGDFQKILDSAQLAS